LRTFLNTNMQGKARGEIRMRRTTTVREALFALLLSVAVLCLASAVTLGEAQAVAQDIQPKDVPILQKWAGEYPISELSRLPEGQRSSAGGYIGDRETFRAVWQAFEPGGNVPQVHFSTQVVVFCRNVHFYNRTSILKITLRDGVAEVLAAETMSAIPIKDKVCMALAVIPRAGIKFIQMGKERIPLEPRVSAAGPLNTTYTIENQEVKLTNGRSEEKTAPGAATKSRTTVFGQPVFGDLDSDGGNDAALILLRQPGGSGSFYYVAAALRDNGSWRGTNAVFLGDRITLQKVVILDGVIVVRYRDRRPGEAMTDPPSVGKTKALAVKEGRLENPNLSVPSSRSRCKQTAAENPVR
jgi:hypothetical protein